MVITPAVSLNSTTKGPLRFMNLPLETTELVFDFVFCDAPRTGPNNKHWRLQPEHTSLAMRGLGMVLQIPTYISKLFVCHEYMEAAMTSYCKTTPIQLTFLPSEDVFAFENTKIAESGTIRASALKFCLEKARILLIDESYFRTINLNLDILRQVCPLTQHIQVTTSRTLFWEHKGIKWEMVTVYNKEQHTPKPPSLYCLNQMEANVIKRGRFAGNQEMFYECLSISRPRSDGLGLSCTDAVWPKTRSLYAMVWCYVGEQLGQVVSAVLRLFIVPTNMLQGVLVDLNENRIISSDLTLRQRSDPKLARTLTPVV